MQLEEGTNGATTNCTTRTDPYGIDERECVGGEEEHYVTAKGQSTIKLDIEY
jgi:hypothetical protein